MTTNTNDKPVKPALLSQTVRAGSRTYFFDIRKSLGRNSDLYLTVTEAHQKEGIFVKNKVLVFGDENLEAFHQAIGSALHFMKEQAKEEVPVVVEKVPVVESKKAAKPETENSVVDDINF